MVSIGGALSVPFGRKAGSKLLSGSLATRMSTSFSASFGLWITMMLMAPCSTLSISQTEWSWYSQTPAVVGHPSVFHV